MTFFEKKIKLQKNAITSRLRVSLSILKNGNKNSTILIYIYIQKLGD